MSALIGPDLTATLGDMLLCEPGSRIEGPTEEVLRVLFETTWYLLRETMTENQADQVALAHLARAHEALSSAGYVVRQYPGE